MKKAGGIIGGILILVGAHLVQMIVAFLGLLAYSIISMILGNIKLDQMENWIMGIDIGIVLYLFALSSLVWIALFGIIYKSSRRMEGKTLVGSRVSLKNILILIIMGFGLQFLSSSALGVTFRIVPSLMEGYQELLNNLGMGKTIISFVNLALLSPIGEELIFRGVVFSHLKKYVSFFTANILQALFFGIFHFNIVQGTYAFVIGLVLGYIAQRFDSIKESILLHMAVNVSACLLLYILPDFMSSTLGGLFIMFVLSICLLVFSFKTVKIERDTVG